MALTIGVMAFVTASGCAGGSPLADSTGSPSGDSTIQVQQARAADDFVASIGTNIHLSYFSSPYGTAWASVVKPKLLALGIRHVRDAGAVLPDDNWMQTVYGRMKELADQGVKFDLIMLPAQGVTDYSSMAQFDRLMSYAAPVVESFEGLNEHDLSSRANWINEVRTFQAALYASVKADPRTSNLPVYGPSMGNPGNAAGVGSLSGVMDYGAIHPYPGGNTPMANVLDHETKTRVITGTRKFVATETGYHTAMAWTGGHPPVSESAMGRYVPRLFLEYFNAGIVRTYLYELIDEGTSLSNREQAFGLLRADGSEKPAYVALKNLISLLNDPGTPFSPGTLAVRVSGDVGSIHRTLLEKRDGRFYLVLWQDAASFNLLTQADALISDRTISVQLTSPATRIRVYDPFNSATPVADLQNAASIPVQVPDSPLVVEITP